MAFAPLIWPRFGVNSFALGALPEAMAQAAKMRGLDCTLVRVTG